MIYVVSLKELISIQSSGYTEVTAQIPKTAVKIPLIHFCRILISLVLLIYVTTLRSKLIAY